jgi:excisionase family DNA binding protein
MSSSLFPTRRRATPPALRLSRDEVARILAGCPDCGPTLTVEQVTKLLHVRRATLYQWVSQGRLDGAVIRRGKSLTFVAERLLLKFFNDPHWN